MINEPRGASGGIRQSLGTRGHLETAVRSSRMHRAQRDASGHRPKPSGCCIGGRGGSGAHRGFSGLPDRTRGLLRLSDGLAGRWDVERAAAGSDPTISMTKHSGATGGIFSKKVGKTLKPLRITFLTLIDSSVDEIFADYCRAHLVQWHATIGFWPFLAPIRVGRRR
jgi:hypothetical protein